MRPSGEVVGAVIPGDAGRQAITKTGKAVGTTKAVRQQGTTLDLDFEGGGTLQIPLAEETSSVMVRDKSGVMEYAD